MGCQPVNSDQIGIFRQPHADIAMQIHRRRNDRFLPDHLPDPRNKIPLGIIQAYHAHRAMDVEVQPVIRSVFLQRIQRLIHQRLVCCSRHSPSRQRVPHNRRYPDSRMPQRRIRCHKRIGGKNCTIIFGMKGRLIGQRRRERTRFDTKAGYGNTGQPLLNGMTTRSQPDD